MDYKLISPDRYNEVKELLRNSFDVDETLCKSLSHCEPLDPVVLMDMDKYLIETLEQNISVMAVSRETNEICGVLVNGILRYGDIEQKLDGLDRNADDAFNKIQTFLMDASCKLNLFQRFNVDQIFENQLLSVNSLFRGQGIGKKLTEKSIDIAIGGGFKIIKFDATGFYSFNISKSLGYEILSEIRYDEYLGKDGQPVFKVDPPNEKFAVMYKQL